MARYQILFHPKGRVRGGALALLLLLSGTTDHSRRLPEDAYVWQRVWTPRLADALRRTAPLVDGFRVLVAEWSPDGTLVSPAIDWPLLRSLGRPVTAACDGHGRPLRLLLTAGQTSDHVGVACCSRICPRHAS